MGSGIISEEVRVADHGDIDVTCVPRALATSPDDLGLGPCGRLVPHLCQRINAALHQTLASLEVVVAHKSELRVVDQ